MYSVACCLRCYCRVTYGSDSIRMKLALDNPSDYMHPSPLASLLLLCLLPGHHQAVVLFVLHRLHLSFRYERPVCVLNEELGLHLVATYCCWVLLSLVVALELYRLCGCPSTGVVPMGHHGVWECPHSSSKQGSGLGCCMVASCR